MLRKNPMGLLLVLLVASAGFAEEGADIKGSHDHPLFTRMPGYGITEYEVKDFDQYASPYASGEDATWEGKATYLSYAIQPSAPKQPSMLQIGRNYANAIKSIGGKVLADDGRVVEGKLVKNGVTTYVHAEAFNEGALYKLAIVEKGAMKQDVAADAAALSASIAATGKAAVYGIYFDTDKAVVKPESDAALKEITKLLKENSGLAIYVVGHTDSDGTLEHNLKLSADRAAAVVKALVGKGIAASRLKPSGVGPYCPVASNHTDDGKAKNRRVELVAQK